MLIWVALAPLAVCLVYSLFYLARNFGLSLLVFSKRGIAEQSVILSTPLDMAVWGIAVFVVLARIGYDLEFNTIKGYFRSNLATALLVIMGIMAVGVVATIVGLVGTVALILISILLLSLCVVFSFDFFSEKRSIFSLRLLFFGLIIGLLVELAGFLV